MLNSPIALSPHNIFDIHPHSVKFGCVITLNFNEEKPPFSQVTPQIKGLPYRLLSLSVDFLPSRMLSWMSGNRIPIVSNFPYSRGIFLKPTDFVILAHKHAP